jgi:hypothetical protein
MKRTGTGAGEKQTESKSQSVPKNTNPLDTIVSSIIDKLFEHDEEPTDLIKVNYYPYSTTEEDSKIINISNIDKTIEKQIKSLTTKCECSTIIGKYTEYGIRDTFVRLTTCSDQEEELETDVGSNNGSSNGQQTRLFFRRVMRMFSLPFSPYNEKGVFVIESYRFCDEDYLPTVTTYDHYTKCDFKNHNLSVGDDNVRLILTNVLETCIKTEKIVVDKKHTQFSVCCYIDDDEDLSDKAKLKDRFLSFFKNLESLGVVK